MSAALTERQQHERSCKECEGLGFIFDDEFTRTLPCNTCDGGVWGRDSEDVVVGGASRTSLEYYGVLLKAVIAINWQENNDDEDDLSSYGDIRC